MRIPSSRRTSGSADNESMTPMIDVVFLLLIFFVVAAIGQKPDTLLPATIGEGETETEVPVEPQEPTEPPAQQVRIRLSHNQNDQLQIQLNERTVDGAQLRAALKTLAELDPESQVILNVADDVLVQQFITIYEYCQALAFKSISFAVPEPAA